MVAATGLECYWPEGPTFGVDEFKGWYDKVTHLFFDEVHTMKSLEITPRGDEADVKLVVNWQAKVWNPPDAEQQVARHGRPPDLGRAPAPRTAPGPSSRSTSSTGWT